MTFDSLKNTLLELNIVVDNQYLDNYCSLIINNLSTPVQKYKTQKHHIIPRCYYKCNNLQVNNESSNLINLLYKDHLLAHYYLSLCGIGKFRYYNETALFFLSYYMDKPDIKELLSKLDNIQNLYTEYCRYNSATHLGKPSWNKNKHYSRKPTSKEARIKASNTMRGKYKGCIWIHKDLENKRIYPQDFHLYEKLGYSLGRNDPEAFKKISDREKLNPNKAMLGKKHSLSTRKKMSDSAKGVKKSISARANMSKARLGKILISNDALKKSFYINKEEYDSYQELGYHKGKLKR